MRYFLVLSSNTPNTEGVDLEWLRKRDVERGLSDIGYHYVVLPDGLVQKGRPDHETGGHLVVSDGSHIEICLVGENGPDVGTYTEPQLQSLAKLSNYLTGSHEGIWFLNGNDLTPNPEFARTKPW
jgi:N-acetylmuramoyl-L-alanine amidase